ncbi:membrane-bound transcription factor site-2 protease [Anoplophora glabripennis]|uniref:membrane-bound transcription factor site-2 protease n=1 Tax=Anoplophora glabripennis TaxID=217634 RepID=UPI0008750A16|nr:membrane-bound transcription factor site-2 protease [Anoplophora glabripennis]
MDITTGFIVIGVIHGVLYFFDNFFKTCAHYPYLKFLEGTGFQISFLSIKWKTKAFNRVIIRWGNSRPRFLHLWFTLGLYASLLLLPVSVLLLLYSFIQNVFVSAEGGVIIEPVVPGVNLPVSELGYYSLTLVLCSIVHELGHALAAVLENVNLIDTGANIFYILPVAYVSLSTEKFSSLNRKNVLKILCAGIWHNLVLTLFAFLLFQALPFIFSSFYHVNKGITIANIAKHSPLLGSKGLSVGDTVYRVNDCDINDENKWYSCLQSLEGPKPAFCIESDVVHSLDESIPLKHLENGNLDCCDKEKSKNICFEYLDSADGVLELPSHACLPGRSVVEKSTNFCSADPHACPNGFYCFRPILANGTNLFKIICEDKNVIYLGLASDIYRTVEVSSYIPNIFFNSTVLPDVVTKFVKYTAVISLGLAIVNVIPFIYMDGQHIADVLGLILLRKRCGKSGARIITVIITWFFTFILVIQCLLTILKVLL